MTRLSSDTSAWRRTGLVVAGMFLWLAATAWIRPLTAPDEGRYVGVAFEMLRSGDWLVPRLDGLPFFHKPPLFYWIGAAAMSVLGPTEWAGRLPSLLGATIAAAGLWLFLRRWADEACARLSAVVLLSMPFFYVGAQFANLDMLVAGCISATVLLAADATLSKERGAGWRRALAGAFLFAALGVLAKGLIGFVLPGLVFVVWCVATGRPRALRLMAWPPGWALFVLLAGPWFVAMQMRYPAFFDYFVVTQHFRRFAASGFNNEHPFWFYLPVIAVLTLPWFGWLAIAHWKARKAPPPWSDVDWLMGLWCLCIVAFFSLPRSKLIGYVLPALPPLACLVARSALAAVRGAARGTIGLRWTIGLAALACGASIALIAAYGTPPDARLSLPAGQTVGPHDEVLMLDTYAYDIPFYWRLQRPVTVWGDWSPALLDSRDDWRKELHDAGRFEPVLGARLLTGRGAAQTSLCLSAPTWVVGASNSQRAHPWLAKLQLAAYNPWLAVWRFAGTADGSAQCFETASDGAMPAPATP
ncbi:Undecaprenyl phosphate-alpha-4-amino-4-deoxy-L-arabinose arabinosyl transferase [Variovorax sp. SRS16]|uniref:ArnT family glycosyltransferase n=1 Tax=Variovorax sp. SRS16 TaxID=282217 RepID=UPI00131716C3|nr:glycosyltransferase family 39 protein [Variovorax sp. SRS16]VTU26438.1 Undecaprenyl phosphate-alpha-4-amino-4-deoxy-L-arabinose arabinosyl transferase [Variovorax sp. SRS16]